ncbi:LamG-like jellyroll fold domain-containing protein [Paenibacillus sp. HJGM_3]|uniref:LamG-like jellyroll fold domain-containing protein n=1 Tax=Paenibacillus sp. HJGM_3 TaxID=3379816 RepID=UPI00385FE749
MKGVMLSADTIGKIGSYNGTAEFFPGTLDDVRVVAVVNRSAQTIQIFVDGTAQTVSSGAGYCGTASGTSVSIAGCSLLNGTSTTAFTIGNHNGTNEFFSGSVDDVRVYARTLNTSEIGSLYNFPGLIGQWKFDEGRGIVSADSSHYSSSVALAGPAGPHWTTGRFGNALEFNREGDYAVVCNSGDKTLNTGSGSFTVTGWFNSTSTATHRRIVSKGD